MINENKFKNICKVSSKIIENNLNSITFLSVSELFVVRPHPIFLKSYKLIFEKFFYLKLIKIFLINFLKLIFDILIGTFTKKTSFEKTKKADFIFFSHLENKDQVLKKNSNDIYFSHIFSNFRKKYNLILLNHTRTRIGSNKNKIILNIYLNFFKELKIFLELFKEFLLQVNAHKIYKKDFEKKFHLLIVVNLISKSTFTNLRIYHQALELISKTKPKKVVITYEGHAYERNILYASNKINKNIKKFAFHHSLPFKNQYSYTQIINNGSDPDYILASGRNSFNKFSSIKKYRDKTIMIGSNRISKFYIKKNKNNNFNCLIIPEGIEEETNILLNFCADYLNSYNKVSFHIRLHPLLKSKQKKFETMMDKYVKEKKVTFSENSDVNVDFMKCNLALYRGTSLIFDAVKSGIVPFYYSKKKEINFDPLSLEGSINTRNKIHNVKEFEKILKTNIFKKNYYRDAYCLPKKKNINKIFS